MVPFIGEFAVLPWKLKYDNRFIKVNEEPDVNEDLALEESLSLLPWSRSCQVFNIINSGVFAENDFAFNEWIFSLPPLGQPELEKLETTLHAQNILKNVLLLLPKLQKFDVNINEVFSLIGPGVYSQLGLNYLKQVFSELQKKIEVSIPLDDLEYILTKKSPREIQISLQKVSADDLFLIAAEMEANLKKESPPSSKIFLKKNNEKVKSELCSICIMQNEQTTIIRFVNEQSGSVKCGKDELIVPLTLNDLKLLANRSKNTRALLLITPKSTLRGGGPALLHYLMNRQTIKGELIGLDQAISLMLELSKGKFILRQPKSASKAISWIEKATNLINLSISNQGLALAEMRKQVKSEFADNPFSLSCVCFNLCSCLYLYHREHPKFKEIQGLLRQEPQKERDLTSLNENYKGTKALHNFIDDYSIPFEVIAAFLQLHGSLLEWRKLSQGQKSTLSLILEEDEAKEINVMQLEGASYILPHAMLPSLEIILSYFDDGKESQPEIKFYFESFFRGVNHNFIPKISKVSTSAQLFYFKEVAVKAEKMLARPSLKLLGFLLLSQCVQLGKFEEYQAVLIKEYFKQLLSLNSPEIRLAITHQFFDVFHVFNENDYLLNDLKLNNEYLRFLAVNSNTQDERIAACLRFFAHSHNPLIAEQLLHILKQQTAKLSTLGPEMIMLYLQNGVVLERSALIAGPKSAVPLAIKIFEHLLTSKKITHGSLEKCLNSIYGSYPNQGSLIVDLERLGQMAQKMLAFKDRSEKISDSSVYAKLCLQLVENLPEIGGKFLDVTCDHGLFVSNRQIIYENRFKLVKLLALKGYLEEMLDNVKKLLNIFPEANRTFLISILLSVNYLALKKDQLLHYRNLLVDCCHIELEDEVSRELIEHLAKVFACTADSEKILQNWTHQLLPQGKWFLKNFSLFLESKFINNDFEFKAINNYLIIAKKLQVDIDRVSNIDINECSALGTCAFIQFAVMRQSSAFPSWKSAKVLITLTAMDLLNSTKPQIQASGFKLLWAIVFFTKDFNLLAPLISSLPKILANDLSILDKNEIFFKLQDCLEKYQNDLHMAGSLQASEPSVDLLFNQLERTDVSPQDILGYLLRIYAPFQHKIVVDTVLMLWSEAFIEGSVNLESEGLFLIDSYRNSHPTISLEVALMLAKAKKISFDDLAAQIDTLFKRFQQEDHKDVKNFQMLFELLQFLKIRSPGLDEMQCNLMANHLFWLVNHLFDLEPKKCLELLKLASSFVKGDELAFFTEGLLCKYQENFNSRANLNEFSVLKISQSWMNTVSAQSLNDKSLDLLYFLIEHFTAKDLEFAEKFLYEIYSKSLISIKDAKGLNLQINIANQFWESKGVARALDSCDLHFNNNCSEIIFKQILLWAKHPFNTEEDRKKIFAKLLLSVHDQLPPKMLESAVRIVSDILIEDANCLSLKSQKALTTKIDLLIDVAYLIDLQNDAKFRTCLGILLCGLAKKGINITNVIDRNKLWDNIPNNYKSLTFHLLDQDDLLNANQCVKKSNYFFCQTKLLLDRDDAKFYKCLERALFALGDLPIPIEFQLLCFKCVYKLIEKNETEALQLFKMMPSLSVELQAELWNIIFPIMTKKNLIEAVDLVTHHKSDLVLLSGHGLNLKLHVIELLKQLTKKHDERSLLLSLELAKFVEPIPSQLWKFFIAKSFEHNKLKNSVLSLLQMNAYTDLKLIKENSDAWLDLLKLLSKQKNMDFEPFIVRYQKILNLFENFSQKREVVECLFLGFLDHIGRKNISSVSLNEALAAVHSMHALSKSKNEELFNLRVIEHLLIVNSDERLNLALKYFFLILDSGAVNDVKRYKACINSLLENFFASRKMISNETQSSVHLALKRTKSVVPDALKLLNYAKYFLGSPLKSLLKNGYPVAVDLVKTKGASLEETVFNSLIEILIQEGKQDELFYLLSQSGIENVYSLERVSQIVSKFFIDIFKRLKTSSEHDAHLKALEAYFEHRSKMLPGAKIEEECRIKFNRTVFQLVYKFEDTKNFHHFLKQEFQHIISFCPPKFIYGWNRNLILSKKTLQKKMSQMDELKNFVDKPISDKEFLKHIDDFYVILTGQEIFSGELNNVVGVNDEGNSQRTRAHTLPLPHGIIDWLVEIMPGFITNKVKTSANTQLFAYGVALVNHLICTFQEAEIIGKYIQLLYVRNCFNDRNMIRYQSLLFKILYDSLLKQRTTMPAVMLYELNLLVGDRSLERTLEVLPDKHLSKSLLHVVNLMIRHEEEERIENTLSLLKRNLERVCKHHIYFHKCLVTVSSLVFCQLFNSCGNFFNDDPLLEPLLTESPIKEGTHLNGLISFQKEAKMIKTIKLEDELLIVTRNWSELSKILEYVLLNDYGEVSELSQKEIIALNEWLLAVVNTFGTGITNCKNPRAQIWLTQLLLLSFARIQFSKILDRKVFGKCIESILNATKEFTGKEYNFLMIFFENVLRRFHHCNDEWLDKLKDRILQPIEIKSR